MKRRGRHVSRMRRSASGLEIVIALTALTGLGVGMALISWGAAASACRRCPCRRSATWSSRPPWRGGCRVNSDQVLAICGV
jgi:hypothetical protein